MKNRYRLWLLFSAVASAIFILDTIADVDVSASVLYVTLVLIVRRTGVVRDILIAGIVCFCLTIASYGIAPGFGLAKLNEPDVLNVIISLFAIASVTYLSIQVANSENKLRRARDHLARTTLGLSVSEIAATVVHEITQPAGAVGANVSAARRWLDMTPIRVDEARGAMEAAACNMRRMEGVIGGLRRMTSVSRATFDAFDVAALIEETVETIRPEIDERRIAVRMCFSQPVLLVIGDRSLLQQVFINLILNAADAMAGGSERILRVEANASDNHVSIAFRDTGSGISVENLDEIFQPFYTTKPNGMGIGLAISQSVIMAHGGSLKASHNKPRGAVISITLPKALRSSAP